MRICPKCGRKFDRLLALSREDNKTMICDDCGVKEALDAIPSQYMSPQEKARVEVFLIGNKINI